jgi:dipeptidyl aminopeptidase/acylaminoacyl peptidase
MFGLSMMQAGIGLVALGFVAMNALAYRHARSMLRFSSAGEKTGKPETLSVSQKLKVLLNGVDLPRPRTSVSVEALGPDARSVRIPVAESVQLGGWYRCQQRGGPLVIFLHGYASEKSGLLPEALAFLELGYSVLLIDFRGSGESSEGLHHHWAS